MIRGYDIIKNIRGKKVVPQETWDYTDNLNKIKPDYDVHGPDDWKTDKHTKKTRDILNEKHLKNGQVKIIEPKYTKNINSKETKKILDILSVPDNKRLNLKRLINSKDIGKILESHNFTGLIIENFKKKKIGVSSLMECGHLV